MTNNTQLLPCPFCGVDVGDLDSIHTASCYFTLAEMLNNLPPSAINREFFQRSDEAWNTRAAPADDVRAGNTASRIRAAVIADAQQEGVNIAEGRFGKSLASLCVSIDSEDVRAVVDEPFVTFELKHYSTMEVRRVSFTGREVYDGITDTVYEKLNLQLCGCESVGETNVVDCNCLDYTDDFDLAGIVKPQRPFVLPERFDIPHRDEYESADHYATAVHEANTWNACLDAVEELNKC